MLGERGRFGMLIRGRIPYALASRAVFTALPAPESHRCGVARFLAARLTSLRRTASRSRGSGRSSQRRTGGGRRRR